MTDMSHRGQTVSVIAWLTSGLTSIKSPDPPRCEQTTLLTTTATGRFPPVLYLDELDPLNYETK